MRHLDLERREIMGEGGDVISTSVLRFIRATDKVLNLLFEKDKDNNTLYHRHPSEEARLVSHLHCTAYIQ